MARYIQTIHDLVLALGGFELLGERLGINEGAVRMWATRQFIPPSWHLRLVLLAADRDLPVSPDLFELNVDDSRLLREFLRGRRRVRRSGRAAPQAAA